MLALQGDGANTDGEEQNYGGVMVEGSGAGHSTSWGDWTKYYDAEYAVDYYHNFRRVPRLVEDKRKTSELSSMMSSVM